MSDDSFISLGSGDGPQKKGVARNGQHEGDYEDDRILAFATDEDAALDEADRVMLADIKAAVLGIKSEEVRIGRFRVLRILGEGSMGQVYEAEDPLLDRRVAIKLHRKIDASAEQYKRISREARILAQLQHDNIVRLYEVGEHEGRVYLVMELVEGQTLEKLQQTGPLPWRHAVMLYAMAGRGLRAAHERGIVHRDFKSTNVIVERNDRCRVLDFGIAREVSTGGIDVTTHIQADERGAVERVPELQLTRSLQIVGTPAYMAPEVHAGQPATPQSDQFSFCVALYESVYGRRPFTGKTVQELMAAKLAGATFAPKDGPRVPSWLAALLLRGLSVDPRDRYPSMVELLADLERSRSGARSWLVLLLVCTAAVVAVVPFMDLSVITNDPRPQHRRMQLGTCRYIAKSVSERWVGVRDMRERSNDELDDINALIDAMLGSFASELGSSCLKSDPRFAVCWQEADRDFEAMLARMQERAPLPVANFSGLAHDFALCLEGEPSHTCTSPVDDGGSAAALSEAKSQLVFGRPMPAEEAAQRALSLALVKDDRLGEILARQVLGEIYDQTERVDEARNSLDEAIAKAMACDALVPTVDAALERVDVELHHRARGRADLVALPLSIARELLASEDGQRLSLRRTLLEEKEAGLLLTIERRCEDALPLYRSVLTQREQSLAVREQQGRAPEPLLALVADAELNLGYALLGCGDEAPAVVIGLFEAAREHRAVAAGGGEHPDLAAFDFGLGRALATYEHREDAVARYEAALATYAKFGVAGEAGANVGDVHVALVHVLLPMGRLDEAQRHALANLEIRRSNVKARSPGVFSEALMAAGMVAVSREAYEDGRRYHQEAVDVLLDEAKVRGLEAREQRTLAYCYGNLALALCGLRRTSECEIAYEEGRRWQLEPLQLANVGNALREHGCVR